MNTRDPVHTYIYWDDDGDPWKVQLTESVAAAGGFTLFDPNVITCPWKPKSMKMRHIGVKEQTDEGTPGVGHRQIPISQIDVNTYKGVDNSVTINTKIWVVVGRTGERLHAPGSPLP